MTYPPLITAIRTGSLEELQLILKKKKYTYPLTAGKQKWTPLHFAAYYGNLPILKLLLTSHPFKSDIKATESKDGFTPLHKAVEKGWTDGIKLLLEHGARIEAKTEKSGSTPLILAIKFGHLEAVKVLLDSKARVKCHNHKGMSPVLMAVEKGRFDILKLLWDRLGPDGVEEIKDDGNCVGRTALLLALIGGHTDIAKFLIENKVDVCISDDDGWGPIHVAVQQGKGEKGLEMLRLLLKERPYLNTKVAETGYTPLHLAAVKGDPSYINELVEAGAKLYVTSNMEYTPLYTAVKFGKEEDAVEKIVEFLVKRGANLGAKDAFGTGIACLAKEKGWNSLGARAELY
ncbi:Ankyrin repeat and SOCS box protein 3 [Orbilia javanica]|uniref:Ankyrin repeat and SOCS box protein 3 n=1 Tax=Orbilia javanica TaxID=47235 RepID=A0AAN8N6V9_9PEZI